MFLGAVDIVVGNVIQNNLKCLSEATDNLRILFITSEPSCVCVYIHIYIRFIYTYMFMICVLWKTQNYSLVEVSLSFNQPVCY